MPSRRGFLSLAASLLPLDILNNQLGGVTLRIIVVKTRSDADAILNKLAAGESFEKLAKKFSIVPSAVDGGYLGSLDLVTLPRQVQDALKGLGPGQTTGPVPIKDDFVILKVVSAAEAANLQSVRPGMGGSKAVLNYDPVTAVSGLNEATDFFLRFPKPPNYQQDLEVNCEVHIKAVVGGIQQLESDLAKLPPGSPDKQLAHYTLAQLYSFQGVPAKAIQHFQKAYDINPSIMLSGQQVGLEKVLGIAELRFGETENCVLHHNADMCIVPISGNGCHQLTSGSENAVKHLLKVLDHDPEDLEAKWLLNLAEMTLGKYPDGVPAKYLLPRTLFESKEDIGKFVDIAPKLGLDRFAQAGSVAIDDFDNDGFLDIMLSTWDHCQSLRYFHNNGDGTFSDRTKEAGLAEQLDGLNIIQTDYNNDGWVDLLVLRGAWLTPVRKSLLRNNGDGTFTDVTYEAGLAMPPTSTNSAVW
ncbi:MAG TPA: FG-GAP-like repeat-containing protein, partial [Terriglobia bacterium]|nr:FG-GAP-like repeat-containing protein [Terriglobia bacterium]